VGQGSVWVNVLPTGPGGIGEFALWRFDVDSRSFSKERSRYVFAVVAGSEWSLDGWVFTRADAETGAATAEIPLSLDERYDRWLSNAYADVGSVWLVLEDNQGSGKESVVFRVDPETGALVSETPLGFLPSGVAAGAGALWLADEFGDSLVRIDVATGRATEIRGVGRNPQGVAVGEGAVWVANARDGTVSRIDPETLDIETIEVGGVPEGVAVGEGGVWVTVGPA
jgi:YVTN family beta-propeller protein